MSGDRIFAAAQRVVTAIEDPELAARERLDAVALAWQFVAKQARDAALAIPGEFPIERAWQVARLEAPQRVVAEAKRLGMVEPPEVRYLAPNGATSAAGAAEVLLSPDVAGELGVRVGDRLRLAVPAATFEVVGLGRAAAESGVELEGPPEIIEIHNIIRR